MVNSRARTKTGRIITLSTLVSKCHEVGSFCFREQLASHSCRPLFRQAELLFHQVAHLEFLDLARRRYRHGIEQEQFFRDVLQRELFRFEKLHYARQIDGLARLGYDDGTSPFA